MKHFKVYEIVSKSVYDKYGENALKFFDARLIELIDIVREILNVPLVCNDWKNGGKIQQRGFRENTSQIVKDKTIKGVMYISAHSIGKGIDFISPKMTAEEMRNRLISNANKLPFKIRMESDKSAPTWLHIDVCCDLNQTEKIKIFD